MTGVRFGRHFAARLFVLALASCGGGGYGGSGNPPPSANRPPAFTSPATASVPENSAGTVYTATASDPDGNVLTFSLSGGADRGRFSITAAGALSFVDPPDFEAPDDADANNVYLVQISASDGTNSVTLDLAVTVTNLGPDSFRVTRVGTGFAAPIDIAALPDGTGRILVVERAGRIRILNPASGAILPTPFLDITGQTTTDGERGLLGLALAPDFQASGIFYIFLTNLAGNIEIRRYHTLAGNRDQADPASADLILAIPHPGFSNHNGGWIAFGPDDFLYLGIGDGGGSGDPNGNGQNRNTLLGKILRIDPAGDSFPADPNRDYRIPAGNPFAGGGGAAEIWAYGLRNPFRASFDGATGNLWIGDVGQGAREEVDLMRPQDGGANFGWNVVEGTLNFTGPPQAGFTPPVTEYSHGTGPRQGRSITGGRVYRGPVEGLRGQYVFADFISGNIWSLPVRWVSLGTTVSSDRFFLRRPDFTPNAGTLNNIVAFGADTVGNLYMVSLGGDIFRLEAA
jgi:glucose/arabinose dehydrogenase